MATNVFDKLLLLLWKNWIIQTRHIIQTVFEILLPVAFTLLLLLIRGLVDPKVFKDPTRFTAFPVNTLETIQWHDMNPPMDWAFAYSPSNVVLEKLVNRSLTKLVTSIPIRIDSNETAKDLQKYIQYENVFVGIEFPDSWANIKALPDKLEYNLRFPGELRTNDENPFVEFRNWFTDKLFPKLQTNEPRNKDRNDGGIPPGYYREGFIPVQGVISTAFIEMKRGENCDKLQNTGAPTINILRHSYLSEDENIEPVPNLFMQRFPYPPYLEDPLLKVLESFIPLIMVVSFLYTSINIVKYITVEKEKQLKEAMKIMGLCNWLHWTAWFIKCLFFFIITISLITIILKIQFKAGQDISVYTYSDWTVIWVYLFVYSISTICFCFALSVLFSKANTASMISGLAWFISYAPYGITAQSYSTMNESTKWGLCIFSNSAMSMGFQLITQHEGNSVGIQWSNLFSPVSQDDTFTVGYTMIMFIVDAFIYTLIALYIEKISPGEYGVPEKWYFPFTISFWYKQKKVNAVNHVYNRSYSRNYESDPIDKLIGIEIKGLQKVFDNKKVAVKNLSLNMFEDQITVLLGHNGAGKTTTMSMLTGMIPATSGTATIDGKDIRTDIDGVRDSLGLCPQHNILFDELTVKEHIVFFSRLKGLKKKDVDAEVQKYVNLLELSDKMNEQSKTLSGGMKRKLSVGVALCGGSRVVLCDEPTSGMDPSARRALWDLLIKEKIGRTILLTTHFMDEADVLGDRIAIMAEGDLKCVGSPFFLKKRFGIGYRLVCVKGNNCDPREVTSLLSKYIPEVYVETDIGSELTYVLNEAFSSVFKNMFADLEQNSDDLNITSYGVSLTPLEEVFLKVGSDSNALDELNGNAVKDRDLSIEGSINNLDDFNNFSSTYTLESNSSMPMLKGWNLVVNQSTAMLIKKFLYNLRNVKVFLIQNAIPVAFLILTILTVRNWMSAKTDPAPLSIGLDKYIESVTVLESSDLENLMEQKYVEMYTELIKSGPASQKFEHISEDFETYILKRMEKNLPEVNVKYLVAASINKNNITAWFNNQAYHTAPLTINLLHNAILKSFCPDWEIKVTNFPLPYSIDSKTQQLGQGNNMGFQLAFNSGFAMAFVSAFYTLFYIKERVTRSKLLQFVSGVNIFTYWIVSFIWDYISFLITILLYLGTLVMFQEEGWRSVTEIGRLLVVLLLFVWAALPMTYLLSFWFTVPSTGFTRMSMLNVLTGVLAFMTVFIMQQPFLDLKPVADSLNWIFFIFPHFSLTQTINNFNMITQVNQFCKMRCEAIPGCNEEQLCQLIEDCCETDNYFSWEAPGSGRNVFFLSIFGVLAFVLLFLKEFQLLNVPNALKFRKNLIPPETEDEIMDSDVKMEKERIKNMHRTDIAEQNLVLFDMTKYYKKFLSVNQLCVGVSHGECFGLLGVNGAGKTSTFKMLTGDENISFGNAFIQGLSLKTEMNKVHQIIGYCPQFDALLEELTGRETLKIYCLLRGIRRDMINFVTNRLATELNFTQHLDKKVKAYSGGNKRKLSTAIALVGNPSVIYLDEPTSGMDPGARRQLWNMICKVRKEGRSVILTSHSMEECENLCTRLAIMVNGEFKCLGSVQHLKNKFSKGFVLTIKLSRTADRDTIVSAIGKIKAFVLSRFDGAFLKEEHSDMLSYHISQSKLKWSEMFGIMEDNKEDLQVEDYSLGQTSLEQVFLFFTKEQRIED